MAVTEQSYTGNGSTTNYSFTFPYLKSTDVEVQVDATVTTAWSFANATTVQFNSAPASGAKIKILRQTNVDSLTATFYPGSAIKSEDLNDNYTQNLYKTQEVGNRFFQNTGGTMTGDLTLGEDVTLTFEGATDNAHETKLTVADPTADRTITLPNVTGTVVTTGDTGTVTSTMLADATIATADLSADVITNAKLADNAVETANIVDANVTTAKIADNSVTMAKISDIAQNRVIGRVASGSGDPTHLDPSTIRTMINVQDGSTDDQTAAEIKTLIASAPLDASHLGDNSVITNKITDGNVTTAKLAADAVTSGKLADNAVVNANLTSDCVTSDKLADNAVNSWQITDANVTTAKIANANITTAKIADDAITEAKLATNSVTANKIGTNAVGSSELADDAVDTTAIADNAVTTAKIAASAVTTAKINADAIDSTKIADNAVTTDHIADAELTTLAGMQSGTASILASSTALAATTTEINSICDGMGVQSTITNDDTKYPTSGAVVDYVAAQIAPLGGLEVIANEDSFPTQPSSGVVISIADAGGIVVNGSGVSTTARTSGNGSDNVTINGFPSSLYSTTLTASMGLMVSSTGSSNTYTYHKLLGKEDDIKQLSDDINDFKARYRINAGEPGSDNDDGDLVWDTNADKMKVYDGTASAWKEVTSSGDFKFLVAVDAGTTTAATFDGSDTSFDLKEATNSGSAASINNINQLTVVLNGVVQKPNAGSWSASNEGFHLTDTDTIRFCTAPVTGSTCFIIQSGSAVSIPVPGDNTVSTAKIQNLAVTGDKVATNLDLADNKKIRFGTGNDLEIYHDSSSSFVVTSTGDLVLQSTADDVVIKGQDDVELLVQGSESAVIAKGDGAVELYYDGTKKLETHATNGVQFPGGLQTPDTQALRLGNSNDLLLYHDGGNSFLANTGGNLYIRNNTAGTPVFNLQVGDSNESALTATFNGAVELYYDGTRKAYTNSGGFALDSHLIMGDSDIVKLGNGADLQIYHDGTDNIILSSGASCDLLTYVANGELAVKAVANGAVELYYDNSKKIATKSNGAFVHGDADGAYLILADTSSNYCYQLMGQDAVAAGAGGRLVFADADGSTVFDMRQAGNNIFCKNSLKLNVDNLKTTWGAGDDLQIYHDGSHSFIKDAGTGGLWVYSNDFNVASADGAENIIKGTENGAVELYYNNFKMIETTASGGKVNGTLEVTSHVKLGNNDTFVAGAGDDLQMYHSGSHGHLKNLTGDLYIAGDSVKIVNGAINEDMIIASANGSVGLRYDNVEKLATVAAGAKTNGTHYFYGHGQGSNAVTTEIWFDSDDDHHGIHFKGQGTSSNTFKACKFEVSGTGGSYGSITYTTSGTGYNSNSSDRRSKKNFEDWTGSVLPDFKAIKPQLFNYNLEEDSVAKHKGYIAQDNVAAFPEAYPLVDDRYQFNPSGMVHYLMKAVQELTEKVETLETKVAALEAK